MKAYKHSAKEDSHNTFQAATRKERKVSGKASTYRNSDQRDEDIESSFELPHAFLSPICQLLKGQATYLRTAIEEKKVNPQREKGTDAA